MTDKIGWFFPPTGGGQEDGYNDSGMAHFRGARIGSLARETIQNSLDAHESGAKAVHMSFEVLSLDAHEDSFGRTELRRAIESCRVRANADEDHGAVGGLTRALGLLDSGEVAYLRISDQNTTGLTERHWKALVKVKGLSVKRPGSDPLGSHGIGKYAPFAVSPLRTVFYWTAFPENGRVVEKLQGKSVLMTHEGPHGPTQGTGFYGYRDGCQELEPERIPRCFRVLDHAGNPQPGTSLSILGFNADPGWQRELAGRVLVSFFFAVSHGNLETTIEPDEELQERELLTIDRNTIGDWFAYLVDAARSSDADQELEDLTEAQVFWQLPREHDREFEKQDQDLGHCRLYLRVEEGLPSKVALVRRSGMLVTTDQRGLKQFRGLDDFAALCVFEDPDGNELLREMENPQHDQFEPERLPDEKKEVGRKALKRVIDWIRSSIREHAKPPETAATSALKEVAELLPDPYAEDDLGGARPVTASRSPSRIESRNWHSSQSDAAPHVAFRQKLLKRMPTPKATAIRKESKAAAARARTTAATATDMVVERARAEAEPARAAEARPRDSCPCMAYACCPWKIVTNWRSASRARSLGSYNSRSMRRETPRQSLTPI